ncbi:MAG: VCBS domain-containing protein, partial [Aquabacterium sp.]|nr:VCBS domain-containing protein [Aquabacterium sp.]
DVDGTANLFIAQTDVAGSMGYGSFSIGIDGQWTYTTTTAHNEFEAGKTYTDSITVAAGDGTTQLITVTITGSNDAAVISGTSTASLTETDAVLSTSGTLTSTDEDGTANLFIAQSGVAGSNGYGTFSIGVDGQWTYATTTAHDEFEAGKTYTDSITVAAGDGTTQLITVTITGTNDAAVISGTSAASLIETDAVLSASGTLTSTDVDGTANLFIAQSGVAGSQGYGTFSIGTDGQWTYTTATAHDEFEAGKTYTDSITVAAADGTTQLITVTIAGSNDTGAFGGTNTATLIETDATLSAGGQLTVNDLDGTPDLFVAQTNVAGSKGYGTFSIGTDGAWTYATNAAYDVFEAGKTYTDSITVVTADGSEQVITVTIIGTNDAAVIGGTTSASLSETDAVLSTSGQLTAADVDGTANLFIAQANVAGSKGYGTFSIGSDGKWSYTTTTARNEFEAGKTYTDSITVAAGDGTTQLITVTITGSNDAAVISGASTASLTETDAVLSTGGTLTSTDVDGTANLFIAQSGVEGSKGYGTFTIGTDGQWTYTTTTANNEFEAGKTYTDSITVAAADGTTQVITVTITGTDDLAVFAGSTSASLTETDAVLSASGQLAVSDPDSTVPTFVAQTNADGSNGHGTFIVAADGQWTYSTNDAQNEFEAGKTYTDSITVLATDGSTHEITVTITGSNDAAVISGTSSASLTETDAVLSASGTLTSTDVDGTANLFIAQSEAAGSNGYGKFSIAADGQWSYTTAKAHNVFEAGKTYTDSVTVKSADGTEQVITVTIIGTNDAAVISGDTSASLVETDAVLSASGTLTSTDVDGKANLFIAQTDVAGSKGYGTFSIGTDGKWTYVTTTPHDEFEAGQIYTDSITVQAADGTEQVITVDIAGSDEAVWVNAFEGFLPDGDFGGARAFYDANGDGIWQEGETWASVQSDGSTGWFTLDRFALTPGGRLVVTGGHDRQSGEELPPRYFDGGDTDNGVLSTLSTVLALTPGLSQAALQASLGILYTAPGFNDGVDLLHYNYVQGLRSGELVGQKVAQANAEMASVLDALALAAGGGTAAFLKVAGALGSILSAATGSSADAPQVMMLSMLDGEPAQPLNSADGAPSLTELVASVLDSLVSEGLLSPAVAAALLVEVNAVLAVLAEAFDGQAQAYLDLASSDPLVAATAAYLLEMADAMVAVAQQALLNAVAETVSMPPDMVAEFAQNFVSQLQLDLADAVPPFASIIGGTSSVELVETDAVLTAVGKLTALDLDAPSNQFVAQSGVVGKNGYGSFSIDADGAWTYTTNGAHDEFEAGKTYTDSITVHSADGTEQVITVTITGTNDAAVISGDTSASLIETNAVLGTSGTLTSTDVDGTANLFIAQTDVAGSKGYGTFSIGADGKWTYTTHGAHDEFEAGKTYTDSITVQAADGTEQVITVTITGASEGVPSVYYFTDLQARNASVDGVSGLLDGSGHPVGVSAADVLSLGKAGFSFAGTNISVSSASLLGLDSTPEVARLLADADVTVTPSDVDLIQALGENDASLDALVNELQAAGMDTLALDAGKAADLAASGNYSLEAGLDVTVTGTSFLHLGSAANMAHLLGDADVSVQLTEANLNHVLGQDNASLGTLVNELQAAGMDTLALDAGQAGDLAASGNYSLEAGLDVTVTGTSFLHLGSADDLRHLFGDANVSVAIDAEDVGDFDDLMIDLKSVGVDSLVLDGVDILLDGGRGAPSSNYVTVHADPAALAQLAEALDGVSAYSGDLVLINDPLQLTQLSDTQLAAVQGLLGDATTVAELDLAGIQDMGFSDLEALKSSLAGLQDELTSLGVQAIDINDDLANALADAGIQFVPAAFEGGTGQAIVVTAHADAADGVALLNASLSDLSALGVDGVVADANVSKVEVALRDTDDDAPAYTLSDLPRFEVDDGTAVSLAVDEDDLAALIAALGDVPGTTLADAGFTALHYTGAQLGAEAQIGLDALLASNGLALDNSTLDSTQAALLGLSDKPADPFDPFHKP